MSHILSTGRVIYLDSLGISGTYAGHMEGTPLTISRWIRENLPKCAAQVLPPATPLAVIPSSAAELPEWFCVARLSSPGGVHDPDPDYNSRLFVCWFENDMTKSVDAMIESILPELNWDRYAEDYSIMF